MIWDVARAAARFCLLYDDGRWSLKRDNKIGEDEVGYVEDDRTTEGGSSSGAGSRKPDIQTKRISVAGEEAVCNVEKDLLRVLAEIHLINAEVIQ